MNPRPILPRSFGFGGALVAGVMADYWTFDQKAARWHVVKDDSFFAVKPWRAFSDQYTDNPISTIGELLDRPYVFGATEAEVLAALKAYASTHTPLATPTGAEPTNFGGTAIPPALPPLPSPATPPAVPGSPDVAALATDADRIRFAYALIKSVLPAANAPQRLIIAAIGKFESGFGLTGKYAPAGVPTFNWGALKAEPGQPYFESTDKSATGATVAVRMARFSTPRDGLVAFMKRWTKAGVDPKHEAAILGAAGDGSADVVADLMYAAGYYQGSSGTPEERRAAYAQAIYNTAKAIAPIVGEPMSVQVPAFPGGPPGPAPIASGSSSGGAGIAIAGVVLGGLFLLGGRR